MSDARANVHEQEWNDYECQFLIGNVRLERSRLEFSAELKMCQFLIGNVRLDEDFAVDAVDDVDSVNSS